MASGADRGRVTASQSERTRDARAPPKKATCVHRNQANGRPNGGASMDSAAASMTKIQQASSGDPEPAVRRRPWLLAALLLTAYGVYQCHIYHHSTWGRVADTFPIVIPVPLAIQKNWGAYRPWFSVANYRPVPKHCTINQVNIVRICPTLVVTYHVLTTSAVTTPWCSLPYQGRSRRDGHRSRQAQVCQNLSTSPPLCQELRIRSRDRCPCLFRRSAVRPSASLSCQSIR